jgi:predicted Zn-dependent protease
VRGTAVRASLVAAAVAAGVWLAGDLRVARDIGRAESLARSGSAPEAGRLLQRAARRTPSSVPDLRYAQLLTFARRPGEASAVLERIVAREPQNAEAWAQLALARRAAGDVAGFARARARYDALSPAVR